MFSFFKKKQAAAVFEIDSPKLSITPNPHNLKSSLKNAEIDYKVVTDGFITFAGCVFDSDIGESIITFPPFLLRLVSS